MGKSLQELEGERELIQEKLRELTFRRAVLEDKIVRKKTKNLNLPTEPGWYEDDDGQIYRLTTVGDWDDGWGNSFFDPGFENGFFEDAMNGEAKLYRLVREEK